MMVKHNNNIKNTNYKKHLKLHYRDIIIIVIDKFYVEIRCK